MLKKFVVCACAVACGLAASISEARDLLRVGTEPTFAPFEFLDSKSKDFTGYDMDLIRAVGKQAGYDVEILNMGFDALIPAVLTGSIDVIAAGVSITPERQKRVDFTTPYYVSGVSMLIRKTDAEQYKTFADLKGKKIGVQIGTTGAEKAKEVPGAKVTSFNTTSEAFMDLMTGNSDAVLLDRPVLGYYLKSQARAARVLTIPAYIADAEEFGFAVKKGNKALLEKLNKAYAELKASGEVDRIQAKWFAE